MRHDDSDTIYDFLMENRKLIFSEANSILGERAYIGDEIISVAYIAAVQFLKKKKNRFLCLKDETGFVWYLKKELYKLKGFECAEDTANSGKSDEEEMEEGVTELQAVALEHDDDSLAEAMSDYSGFKGDPRVDGGKFIVDIESFNDNAVSHKVVETLCVLAGRSSNKSYVRTNYRHAMKDNIADHILFDIKMELFARDLKIFHGDCLNGYRSRVYVCAKNQSAAAQSYFPKYGQLLRIREFSL